MKKTLLVLLVVALCLFGQHIKRGGSSRGGSMRGGGSGVSATWNNPSAHVQMANYNMVNQLTGDIPGIAAFLGTHIDYFVDDSTPIAQSDMRQYNSHNVWLRYVDTLGEFMWSYYDPGNVRAIIAAGGWCWECVFIHSKINYQPLTGYTVEDQFDVMEKPNGTAAHGVFLYNVGTDTFTDVTAAAYAGGSITVASQLGMGYGEAFDEANFVVTSPATGATITWEYWNGSSYGALTLASDTTNGLTQSGKIKFTPPANWTRRTENGSYSKYWIKADRNSGTAPVISTVKAARWCTGQPCSSNQIRGWSSTDSNRINTGTEVEYNPTPPVGATANFPYQARITNEWQSSFNNQVMNKTYKVGSVFPWGKAWADLAVNSGYSGGLGDNASSMSASRPADSDTDQNLTFTIDDWWTYVTAYAHSAYPGKLVGGNFINQNTARKADVGFSEINIIASDSVTVTGGSILGCTNNTANYEFGCFAPGVNNPNSTVGLFQCVDTVDYRDGFTFDRSNRGPLACLGQYYLGANANTLFAYHWPSWGQYYETEDVHRLGTFTTLTATRSADTSGASKTITVTSTAGAVTQSTAWDFLVTQQLWKFCDDLNGDLIHTSVTDSTHLSTTDPIARSYSSGAHICPVINQEHLSKLGFTPTVSTVYVWGAWFPAMAFDTGVPDAAGFNAGVAGRWLNTSAISSTGTNDAITNQVFRRDFMNAIVLHRPYSGGQNATDASNPSLPLCVSNAAINTTCPTSPTYSVLKADGTLGSAVTSVQIRAAESMILRRN